MKTSFISPVSLALLTSIGVVRSAEWDQYRGPSANGRSPEKISKAWPSEGPKQVWKVESKNGFSSFAVVGGRAFTQELRNIEGAELESLVARDAGTGKELWVTPIGGIKTGNGGQDGAEGNKGGDGPRSSPAVRGNLVYTFSARLSLQATDATTGKSVWKHDLLTEYAGRNINWENAQSPVLEGDLVLVSGGGAGQTFLAFKQTTGDLTWKSGDDTMTHATASPVTIHGQRQVIFFMKSGLVSLDPTSGKELWRHPFTFKVSTAASPVIHGDIVYCSAGYGVGGGACRVSKNGTEWSAEKIYMKEGNKPLANHWSTPVLHEGNLYGMFQFKEYGTGPVKCVDIATGNVRWEKGGFGPGHVMLVDGHVLALSDDGQLVLFEASPTAYKEIARHKALSGKCWTMPVVSNGRIYARSTTEAICLDVGVKSASNQW